MVTLLRIEIDHSILFRYTRAYFCIFYLLLATVYTMFGYYAFIINRRQGMIVQYVSYVIINGTFVQVTIQFHVFLYALYTRLLELNVFLE